MALCPNEHVLTSPPGKITTVQLMCGNKVLAKQSWSNDEPNLALIVKMFCRIVMLEHRAEILEEHLEQVNKDRLWLKAALERYEDVS